MSEKRCARGPVCLCLYSSLRLFWILGMGSSESCDLHFEYSSDWTWPGFSWESALTQDSLGFYSSLSKEWTETYTNCQWTKSIGLSTRTCFYPQEPKAQGGSLVLLSVWIGWLLLSQNAMSQTEAVGVHLLAPLSNSIEQTCPCCSWQGWLPLSLCEGRCSTSNNTALDLSNTEKNVNETKQLW